MRSLLLSLALLASAGLAALTPSEASAAMYRSYYPGASYYSGYSYAPSYYGAAPYYTTSPYGAYSSPYGAYSSPYGAYSSPYSSAAFSAPVVPYSSAAFSSSYYQTYQVAPSYAPVYSGPGYYRGYAPNRAWIYP